MFLDQVAIIQAAPEPGAVPAAAVPHIRRCAYRRMSLVSRGSEPLYDVECLYPDRVVPIPLGDLSTARPICDACQASHIFRADED